MTRSRTALVTGSAGFVGRHTVDELRRRGYNVAGIDLAHLTAEPTAIRGDALDWFAGREPYNSIDNNVGRFDLVVHCAAVVGGRTMIDGRPLELAAVDLELDAALFRWALRRRPRRVLYLSSSAAYPVAWQTAATSVRLREDLIDHAGMYLGTPDATYGLVKLVGERLALEAAAEGIPVTVVRPFSGYGPDQALDYPFPSFIDRALRRADPFDVWGTGEQVRDFVHIDDVVRIMLDLAEAEVNVPVNIGTGRPTSFLELAHLVTVAAGYRPAVLPHPDKPVGVAYRVADTELLTELGLRPTITLEAGIRAALNRPAREVRDAAARIAAAYRDIAKAREEAGVAPGEPLLGITSPTTEEPEQ